MFVNKICVLFVFLPPAVHISEAQKMILNSDVKYPHFTLALLYYTTAFWMTTSDVNTFIRTAISPNEALPIASYSLWQNSTKVKYLNTNFVREKLNISAVRTLLDAEEYRYDFVRVKRHVTTSQTSKSVFPLLSSITIHFVDRKTYPRGTVFFGRTIN